MITEADRNYASVLNQCLKEQDNFLAVRYHEQRFTSRKTRTDQPHNIIHEIRDSVGVIKAIDTLAKVTIYPREDKDGKVLVRVEVGWEGLRLYDKINSAYKKLETKLSNFEVKVLRKMSGDSQG